MTDQLTDEVLQKRVQELESRVAKLEAALSGAQPPRQPAGGKEVSLREFLNDKKPTSANDRALCIGFFLETSKGYDSFGADDIKAGFREARIQLPKNPNDIINKNIAKAFMMDAEPKNGKKAWVLTNTGMEFVQNNLGHK